ncbi:MAG: hypothetical protein R3C14_24320 [Caldilineaceae bacterium]
MQIYKMRIRVLLLICIICTGLSAVYPSFRAYAELPPRPTKTPVPDKDRSKPEPPAGTLILNTQPTVTGLWSVVQWQDEAGQWRDVEGWRGEINAGKTIWWVEEEQWNTGPFRWAIFETKGNKLLAASELFVLPGSGETHIVRVYLPR